MSALRARTPQTSRSLLCQAIDLMLRGGAGRRVRPDGATAYEHGWGVANLLIDAFGITDPQSVAAALLHEALAHGITSAEQISSVCGGDAARIVEAVTRLDGEPLPAYVERVMGEGSPEVEIVTCDCIDELRRVRSGPHAVFDTCLEGVKAVYMPCLGRSAPHCVATLTAAFDDLRVTPPGEQPAVPR